jgi:hypothetical protein
MSKSHTQFGDDIKQEKKMEHKEDAWDVLGGASTPSIEASSRLDTLADQLLTMQTVLENSQQACKHLSMEIANHFDEILGVQEKELTNFTITCTHNERWIWDKTKLQERFDNGLCPPDYVKKSLTIDKKKFQSLPITIQGDLRDALTRKLEPAKVKVVKNVKD